MASLSVQDTEPLEVSGRVVSGVSVRAYLKAAAVNVALLNSDLLLKNITVTIELLRNGKSYRIAQGPLLPFLVASAAGRGSLSFISPIGGTLIHTTVAHGVAVKAEGYVLGLIDFKGVIRLTGDDILKVIMTSNGTEYSSAIDSTASKIVFDTIEGSGPEWETPVLDLQTISPGVSNKRYGLGSGVGQITFVCLDKSGNLAANQVLTSSLITSDQFKTNDQFQELRAKNAHVMSAAEMVSMGQSLILSLGMPEVRLTNVDCELSLTSANVTNGNCYIVSSRYISSSGLRARAEQTKAEISTSVRNNDLQSYTRHD